MHETVFAGHCPEKCAFFQKKPDFKGREASWMGTQELEQKIKI